MTRYLAIVKIFFLRNYYIFSN